MVAWAMPTISQTFYPRGGFHIRPVCGEGRYKICPYEISQIVDKATPRRCDEMRTVPRHFPKAWVRRQDAAFWQKKNRNFVFEMRFRLPETLHDVFRLPECFSDVHTRFLLMLLLLAHRHGSWNEPSRQSRHW